MSNGIGGFFVPSSRSSSYVLSKRNEEGSYKYDAQIGAVGMQKQAALQDLQKTYEATINKAYSSYLANQSAINNSQMGQGYKELYEQKEQENLLAQQEQVAMNVSQVKSQLLSQEQQSLSAIQQQYLTETANLDRVARSMTDYLNYVKSLEGGVDYLSKLSGKTITDDTLAEDLYESLYAAQPQQLTSMEDPDIKGMAYSEWLHNQMKDTEADRNFEQWLFSGGGWQDFQKATGLYKDETPEGKAYREIDEARREKVKIAEEERLKQQEEESEKTSEGINNIVKSIADSTEFDWNDSVTLFNHTTFVDENNKWVKPNISKLEKAYSELGIDPKYAKEDLKSVGKSMKAWFNDTGTYKAGTQRNKFKKLLQAKIQERLK